MGSVDNKSADMEEEKVYGFVDLFKSVGDAKPVHIYQLSMRKIKIGREQKCDIRIHNLRISRIQCAIKVSGTGESQQVRLQNLTTKATTVYKNEGIPQNSTVVLQDGDRFRLYDTELRFRAYNPNETNGFPESSDGRNPPIIRLSDREKTHTPEKSSLYKKSPRSEKSRPSRSSTRVNDRMNKSVDSSDKTPKRRKSSDLNLRKSVILKSFRKSVQGKNFPPDIPENPELIELEDDDEDGEEVDDDETETTQQSEEPMEIDEDEADTQTSTEPDPIEIVKPRNSKLSNNSVRCAESPEDLIHLSPLVQSPPGGELSEDLIQFHDIEREMSLLHGEESANNVVENEDDAVLLDPASDLLEPVSPSTLPISDSSEPSLSLPLVADTPKSTSSQVALKPASKKNNDSITVTNISEPNSMAVTSEGTGDVNVNGNSDEEDENQSIHESCTQVVDLQETLNLDGKSYYTAADEDEHGDLCIDESHLLNDGQRDPDLNKTTSDKSDDAEDVFEDAQGDENGTESNDLFEDSGVNEAVDPVKAGTLSNGDSEDVELIDGGIEILAEEEKGPENNDQKSSNQSLHSSKDLLQSNDDELADEDEQSNDEQDEEEDEEPEVVDIADDSSENEDNDNANNYSLDSDDGLESELIDLVDSPEILSVDSPHEPLPDISPEDVESIPVADSPSPVGSEELQDCIPVVNESDNEKESSSAVDKDVEDTGANISLIENTPLVLSDTDISEAANSCGVDKIATEVASEVEAVVVAAVAPGKKKEKSVNSADEGAVADAITAIENAAEASQSCTADVTDGDDGGSDDELGKPEGNLDDELAVSAGKVATNKDVVFVNTEEISLENEEEGISGVEEDLQNSEKSAIQEPEKTDGNLVEGEPADDAGDKFPHEEITEAQKDISSSRIIVNSTVVDSDSDIEDDLKSVSDFNGGRNEPEATEPNISPSPKLSVENENMSVPVPVATENAQDSVSGKPSSSSNRVEAMEIEDNKENIVEPISDDADSENGMVEQPSFRAGSGRISSVNDKNKSSTPKKQSSLSDNIVNKNYAVKDCSVVLSRIIIQVDTADLSDDGEAEDVIPQINDAEAVFSDLTNEPLSSTLNATAKLGEVCVINETPEAKTTTICFTPKRSNQVSISQSIQVSESKISTPTSSRHTGGVSPIATSAPQVNDDVSVVPSDDKVVFTDSEPSTGSSLILSEKLETQSTPDFNLTGTRAASLSKTLEIPSDPSKLLSEGETPVTSEVYSKTASETTPKLSALISPVSTPKDLATSSPSLPTPIVAEKSISSTPTVKNCSIVIERLSISTEDGSILKTTPTPRSKNKTLDTSQSALESPKSSVRQLQESSDITKAKQRGRKKASDIELVNLEEPETEDEVESNKKVVDDLDERKEPASSTSRAVRTRAELDETRVPENPNLTPKRGRPKILQEKKPEPELEMDTENTKTRKDNSKKDTEDSADESESDQAAKSSPRRGRPRKDQVPKSDESAAEKVLKPSVSSERILPRSRREASESEESEADKFVKPLRSPIRARGKNRRQISESEESEADKLEKPSKGRGRPKRQPAVVASESEAESDADKIVKPSLDRVRPKRQPAVASESEVESDTDKIVKPFPSRVRPKRQPAVVASESEVESDVDRVVKPSPGRGRPRKNKTTSEFHAEGDAVVIVLEDDSDKDSDALHLRNKDDQLKSKRGRESEDESRQTEKKRKVKPDSPQRERTTRQADENVHLEEQKPSGRKTRGQVRNEDVEEISVNHRRDKQAESSTSKRRGGAAKRDDLENVSDSESEKDILPKSKRGRYENEVQTESNTMKNVISKGKGKSQPHLKDSRVSGRQVNTQPLEDIQDSDEEEVIKPVVKLSQRETAGAKKEEIRGAVKDTVKALNNRKPVVEENDDEEGTDAPSTSVTRGGRRARTKDGSQLVVASTHVEEGGNLESTDTENLHALKTKVEVSKATNKDKNRKGKAAIAPPLLTSTLKSRENRKNAIEEVHLSEDEDADTDSGEQNDLPSSGPHSKATTAKLSNKSINEGSTTSQIMLGKIAQPIVLLEYMDSDDEKEKMDQQRKRNRVAARKANIEEESDDDKVKRKSPPKRGRTRKGGEHAGPSNPEPKQPSRPKRLRRHESTDVVIEQPEKKKSDDSEENSDSDGEPVVPERIASAVKPDATPTVRSDRGRFRGVNKVPVHEATVVVDSEDEVEPATKTRRARLQSKEELKEREKNVASAKVTKGKSRPGKKEVEKAPLGEMSDEEQEEQQPAASRKNNKKAAEGPSSKAREIVKPALRRGRQAKGVEMDVEESSDDEVETVSKPEPVKSAERPSSKSKGKTTIKPARLGRQAKVTESKVEESSDDEVEAVPKPEPPKSAKQPSSKSTAKATIKPVRPGRQAKVTEVVVEDSSDDEVEAVSKPEPVKSVERPSSKSKAKTTAKPARGGRQAKVAESKVEESSDDEVEAVPEPEPPKSAKRPISKQVKTITKPRRGRQAKVAEAEVKESSDDEVETVQEPEPAKSAERPSSKAKAKATVKPSHRGRQAKVAEAKVKESSDDEAETVQEPEPPKSAKRGVKRTKENKKTSNSEQAIDNDITNSGVTKKTSKSSKKESSTKGKSQKVQIVQKAPKDRVVLQLPDTDDNDVIDLSSDEEQEPSVSPVAKRLRAAPKVPTPAKTRATKPTRPAKLRRGKK